MSNLIIIEGAVARLVNQVVYAEVPVEEIRNRLTTTTPFTFPILPRNTVAVSVDETGTVLRLLAEAAPQIARLKLHYKGTHDLHRDDVERLSDDVGAWTVAIPYSYWRYTLRQYNGNWGIEGVYYWWRPKRYAAPTDKFWPARVPNLGGDGDICFGSTSTAGDTMAERIATQTSTFFDTVFNDDLELRLPDRYDSYTEWEEATERDMFCWKDWNWVEHDDTFTFDSFNEGSAQPVDLTLPTSFRWSAISQWVTGLTTSARANFIAALLETPSREEQLLSVLRGRGYAITAPNTPEPANA